MLRTIDKYPLYVLERVWFDDVVLSKADIIRFTRCITPKESKWYTIVDEHITVVNDLQTSDDELQAVFKKNVRYEIRRAVREGVTVSHYSQETLSYDSDIVTSFVQAYKECANSIDGYNLMDVFSERKLRNFIDNKCIHISVAEKEDVKIYHVYVHDEKETVLIYSISNFRANKEDEYIAGMANKLLHFEDMKYFRDLGLSIYDWGNISSDTDFNGIDVFKMSFGGNISKCYSTFYGNTLKGKLLVFAKKTISNRKKQ